MWAVCWDVAPRRLSVEREPGAAARWRGGGGDGDACLGKRLGKVGRAKVASGPNWHAGAELRSMRRTR